MSKTLATLIAIPMLFIGVAFAADQGGRMDLPGSSSDTGVVSTHTQGDTSSANRADERGDDYKAPEAKGSLPDWLQAPFKGESPDASPYVGGGGGS